MSMDMKDLTGFSTDEKSIDTWKGLVGLELLIDPSVKKILEFTKENLNTADSDQVLGSLRTNIPDLFEESTDISSYKLSATPPGDVQGLLKEWWTGMLNWLYPPPAKAAKELEEKPPARKPFPWELEWLKQSENWVNFGKWLRQQDPDDALGYVDTYGWLAGVDSLEAYLDEETLALYAGFQELYITFDVQYNLMDLPLLSSAEAKDQWQQFAWYSQWSAQTRRWMNFGLWLRDRPKLERAITEHYDWIQEINKSKIPEPPLTPYSLTMFQKIDELFESYRKSSWDTHVGKPTRDEAPQDVEVAELEEGQQPDLGFADWDSEVLDEPGPDEGWEKEWSAQSPQWVKFGAELNKVKPEGWELYAWADGLERLDSNPDPETRARYDALSELYNSFASWGDLSSLAGWGDFDSLAPDGDPQDVDNKSPQSAGEKVPPPVGKEPPEKKPINVEKLPTVFKIMTFDWKRTSTWSFKSYMDLLNAMRNTPIGEVVEGMLASGRKAVESSGEIIHNISHLGEISLRYESPDRPLSVTCKLAKPNTDGVLKNLKSSPRKNGICYYLQFGDHIFLSEDKNFSSDKALATLISLGSVGRVVAVERFPEISDADIGKIERVWKLGKSDEFHVTVPQGGWKGDTEDRDVLKKFIQATAGNKVVKFS
ncbi:MAG: hypothetical protein H0T78_08445 [Longispora sp.]|nr:hypothetical protein [Longispora sp. (in: high G+C Gram-positive bacteria)]